MDKIISPLLIQLDSFKVQGSYSEWNLSAINSATQELGPIVGKAIPFEDNFAQSVERLIHVLNAILHLQEAGLLTLGQGDMDNIASTKYWISTLD